MSKLLNEQKSERCKQILEYSISKQKNTMD